MNLLIDMEVIQNTRSNVPMRINRVGKKPSNSTAVEVQSNHSSDNGQQQKVRPIKISFQDNAFRDLVLRSCKNIKDIDDWKGISIVPDLTKVQQRLSKTNRKKLQEKADKNNAERSPDEIQKGTVWKVTGHYGNGNLRLTKYTPSSDL